MSNGLACAKIRILGKATPKLVGTGTIAFYFDAKKEGEDTVTLMIDGAEYTYKFKVVKK